MSLVASRSRKVPNSVEDRADEGGRFQATMGLVETAFAARNTDPKLRRTIILRAAKVLGVPPGARGDETVPSEDRLSAEEIWAIASDGPVEGLAPSFVVVCAAVDELFKAGTLTHDTLRGMLDRFGNATVRTIVLIIGCLNLVSMFLNRDCVPKDRTAPVKTILD